MKFAIGWVHWCTYRQIKILLIFSLYKSLDALWDFSFTKGMGVVSKTVALVRPVYCETATEFETNLRLTCPLVNVHLKSEEMYTFNIDILFQYCLWHNIFYSENRYYQYWQTNKGLVKQCSSEHCLGRLSPACSYAKNSLSVSS